MTISDFFTMSDNQKWHFDKSINAGHILTAVPILLGIVFFGTNLQQGVSSNTQSIVYLNERHVKDIQAMDARHVKDIQATNDRLERFMSRVDQQRLEDMGRVEKRLDNIDDKLDRLISVSGQR